MRRFLLLVTLAAMPLISRAIEEPDYEVIRKFDNVELRRYAPNVHCGLRNAYASSAITSGLEKLS